MDTLSDWQFDFDAILKNLAHARVILAQAESRTFNLGYYQRETECGTLMCSYGHLSCDSHFRSLGVTLLHGFPPSRGGVFLSGQAYDWLDPLFGPNAFNVLFRDRCYGTFDGALLAELDGDEEKPISDKMLALARIDRQIAIVTARQAQEAGHAA